MNKNTVILFSVLLLLSVVGNLYLYQQTEALSTALENEKKKMKTQVQVIEKLETTNTDLRDQESIVNQGKKFIETYFGVGESQTREQYLRQVTNKEVQDKLFPPGAPVEHFEENYKIQVQFDKTYFNWENETRANLIFKITTISDAGQVKIVYEYEMALILEKASNGWLITKFEPTILNAPVTEGGGH